MTTLVNYKLFNPQVLNGIALIITIVISYLSNTEIFNGNTIASVSSKNQNFFTIAGYTFQYGDLSILGMLGFVFYYGQTLLKPTKKEDKTIE